MKKIKIITLYLLSCLLLVGCQQATKEEVKHKESEISVSVKDLSPPNITLTKNRIEIIVGDDLDLSSYIKVTDNVTKNIEYKLEGDYDKNVPGEYAISIFAKDEEGNATNKEIKIIVKEKELPKEETKTPASNTVDKWTGNSSTTQSEVVQPPLQIPLKEKPQAKQFLFSNGYTTSTGNNPADRACSEYLFSQQGSGYGGQCKILYSEDEYPIGTEAIFF
ncbi:hypothetical protein [Breznakia blatticola]|uniref:hypothetical protein n=1 Tax=Breznakia blatticola TaxID=1754012 RepID=UPI001064D0BB|nr:hypothetical protein [Breznakia blatticola]